MLHPKTQVFSGILAKEAEQLVLEFFKKLRG
jgi:tRNA(adenine34) deaminase